MRTPGRWIVALALVGPTWPATVLAAPADDATEVASQDAPEAAPEAASEVEPSAPADAPAPAEPSPPAAGDPPRQPVAAKATSTPAIDDASWTALKGKQIEVTTKQGPRRGELAGSEGDAIVLIGSDGRPTTIAKRDATDVRVVAPAAKGSDLPTTPPPASGDPAATEEQPSSDPKEARKQKRKERREKREHALLGAMTAHGAAYAHWRGDGVSAGHAAYLMDWGVGANLSPKFGMYLLGGGVLAARIDDKSTKANYGRIAFMLAFGGKWYFSTFGVGAGFNRLRFPDDTLQKDVGLALPFKIFGKIPLPKKLDIGIGLSYELGALRGFGRFMNAIGGQIVFGRW